METNDNTILEMQQQMKRLREKLESQKIVNERMLRNSWSNNARRLKFKSSVPIFAGAAALLCLPGLYSLGLSVPFLVFTGALMAVCAIATFFVRGLIPDVNKDMVSAARDMVRFRKIHKDWIKFGLPALAVWLGLFLWDLWKNTDVFESGITVPVVCGVLVGLVAGVALGLKNRRDVLDTSDELLAQIEELKG